MHAARALEKIGANNIIAFERKMSDVYPNIDPISILKRNGQTVAKGRRVDAVVKTNTNIEFKGSSKDVGNYKLNPSAEVEFLNDAIYFARANQKFEWQIARQLDIGPAKKKMEELLGNGNIPAGLDKRLLGYIETLSDADQRVMLDGLRNLVRELNAGTIIKTSEYID